MWVFLKRLSGKYWREDLSIVKANTSVFFIAIARIGGINSSGLSIFLQETWLAPNRYKHSHGDISSFEGQLLHSNKPMNKMKIIIDIVSKRLYNK